MALREKDLCGLWRRVLLQRENQAPDQSTDVYWLQTERFFVDLRQPAGRPSFDGVACLRDLRAPHLQWLALQEGFAGHIELDDPSLEWKRAIDFQPTSSVADRARVRLAGDILDEYGIEAAYYEQWVREAATTPICWGVRLERVTDGRCGFLVRIANRFLFARARGLSLPPCGSLTEALERTPSLAAKQDVLDFEISFGNIAPGGGDWLIERSTLPYKEGCSWSMDPAAQIPDRSGMIELGDVDASGGPLSAAWRVVDSDGA